MPLNNSRPTDGFRPRVHAAFTLIELLVVIGIIGILAGVMAVAFGGATESARATQCLSNMKSLAQAANATAMRGDWYPVAGSFEHVDQVWDNGNRLTTGYREWVGWISWLSNRGDAYRKRQGSGFATSHQSVDLCPFYGAGTEDDTTFAITNGSIWAATGKNRSIYTCPTHVRYRQEQKLSVPYWSYVMNAKFGYDYSQGARAVGGGIRYGSLSRADRTLMFAELSMWTIEGKQTTPVSDGDVYSSDCTLQYKATVDGKTYGTSWAGTPESIGFNHRVGKRSFVGHVAYADGHVAKITYVENGGLDTRQLTALLCEGKDVAFDGQTYKELNDD